ncbi:c-SKI Smad4 binding domain protein [Cooperia oncophora]
MFGTVKGWAYPSRKGGRSVRCQECECLFTPQDFVAHSHSDKNESQRTVHWGFDPSNWRLMLELAKPSSDNSVSKERWKEFIDEPTIQSCGASENFEEYPVNKAKRTFTDQSLEVPTKVARNDDVTETDKIEKPLPLFSDPSNLSKLYLRDNMNRLFGTKPVDPLGLLGDIMQKEAAFKVKSLAAIKEQPSGIDLLLPLSQQTNSVVPHPDTFKTAGESAKELRSNCDQLEALESLLSQTSGISPTITNTLREIRTSLTKGTMVEYERLRHAYEFLFTLYRQMCDPIGCMTDPVMQPCLAKLQADQAPLGTMTDSSDSLRVQTLADLAQEQAKLGVVKSVQQRSKGDDAVATFPYLVGTC